MGLSTWLVWAERGFHKQPNALPLCATQLGLSLLWKPVVLLMGSNYLDLVHGTSVCQHEFLFTISELTDACLPRLT
ncbi:hypothetical protein MKW94_027229 [Papaver nudicaule]|uniref:Uncharacterized protein n=1 Tax=Papaver nudicaule TaxID=74823 RepID=A0AA41SLR0_PAPNU|nr:hypothetical protein [Papaver nudicaule]